MFFACFFAKCSKVGRHSHRDFKEKDQIKKKIKFRILLNQNEPNGYCEFD